MSTEYVDCDFDDTCNDASSICSLDVAEMMMGFTAGRAYESPKKQHTKDLDMTSPTNSTVPPSPSEGSPQDEKVVKVTKEAPLGGYDPEELNSHDASIDMGNYYFDLGPLKMAVAQAESEKTSSTRPSTKPLSSRDLMSKATEETRSRMTGFTESDLEEDDEWDGDASIAIECMLPLKGLGSGAQQSMGNHMENSIMSSMDMAGIFFNKSTCSDVLALNGTAASSKLEERRAARAARMEKVRQRIAREKELAKQKQQETEWQSELRSMTEEARRQRAYEWYCRCGMAPRKELKKRVQSLPASAKLTADDIDLLPWNFNGSMVNAAKLNKMGVVQPGSSKSLTAK